MAFKAVKAGGTLEYTNSGSAITEGDVVIVNNLICVAAEDIAATTGVGTLYTDGVFDLPKVSAAVIAQGEMVIWDVSAGEFDDDQATPATGDITLGAFADSAAGNGVTTVRVRLVPGGGVVN
ncbi:MAG: capsid cement protein [Gammaproteobacteria bacterium]